MEIKETNERLNRGENCPQLIADGEAVTARKNNDPRTGVLERNLQTQEKNKAVKHLHNRWIHEMIFSLHRPLNNGHQSFYSGGGEVSAGQATSE